MPSSPNKISQFWQELKRRNVVRVITIYAGAAFVILELPTAFVVAQPADTGQDVNAANIVPHILALTFGARTMFSLYASVWMPDELGLEDRCSSQSKALTNEPTAR